MRCEVSQKTDLLSRINYRKTALKSIKTCRSFEKCQIACQFSGSWNNISEIMFENS